MGHSQPHREVLGLGLLEQAAAVGFAAQIFFLRLSLISSPAFAAIGIAAAVAAAAIDIISRLFIVISSRSVTGRMISSSSAFPFLLRKGTVMSRKPAIGDFVARSGCMKLRDLARFRVIAGCGKAAMLVAGSWTTALPLPPLSTRRPKTKPKHPAERHRTMRPRSICTVRTRGLGRLTERYYFLSVCLLQPEL